MTGPCDLFNLPGGQPGCGSGTTASVRVTVSDAEGAILPFAVLTFWVNGGPANVVSCQGECADLPLAFNTIGRFHILVTSPNFLDARRTVDVSGVDQCTPLTENVFVVLAENKTVAVLNGAWRTNNLFGESILRFGEHGEIIGAILFDRTIAGDGNFYISFNDRPIRGVPDQAIGGIDAADPTRTGDRFDFVADTFGIPVGFEDATISKDGFTLTGTLAQTAVTYERLPEVPEPLRDP